MVHTTPTTGYGLQFCLPFDNLHGSAGPEQTKVEFVHFLSVQIFVRSV